MMVSAGEDKFDPKSIALISEIGKTLALRGPAMFERRGPQSASAIAPTSPSDDTPAGMAETFLLTGGGSGGHLYPGIAVAEELRRQNPACKIVFVGSERPVERTILEPTGFEHHALPVEPLALLRKQPFRFLRRNWAAFRQARKILLDRKPKFVIGLGGYISVPAVWWASRLRVPVLLLEQNAIPGAATRWLAGCARHICLSFDGTHHHLRTDLPLVLTGNPIRQSLHSSLRASDSEFRTLLILGGSQGAESLNDAVVALLPELRGHLAGWRIVHQTGAGRAAAVRERYQKALVRLEDSANPTFQVEEFFPNITEQYAQADLVLSRAGATTLAELACVGCPAVLVPYPFAADQHQAANAEVFARHGAAVVIEQATTLAETAARLRGPLIELLTDASRRAAMSSAMQSLARPDAAREIAELLSGRGTGGSPVRFHTKHSQANRLRDVVRTRSLPRETH